MYARICLKTVKDANKINNCQYGAVHVLELVLSQIDIAILPEQLYNQLQYKETDQCKNDLRS